MKPTTEDTFSLYRATTFVELAGQYLDLILLNKDIPVRCQVILKDGTPPVNDVHKGL